jgi:hypothetical protein
MAGSAITRRKSRISLNTRKIFSESSLIPHP